MALTDRSSEAIGGPRGGTCWFDCGDSFTLAQAGANGHTSFTVTTTLPGLIPAQTVSRPNPFIANSPSSVVSNTDALDSTQILQTLYGFQVSASVLMAAAATLTLTLSVYRTVALQSGAGGSGTTSVPLKAGLTQAIPNSSTLTITQVAGGASTTLTTTAATPAGATSIPVSSVNLTGYADSSVITWQVGNGAAFGWVGGSGGTPTFPVGGSVVAPTITTNTSLITTGTIGWGGTAGGTTAANAGGVPVQAGDVLALNVVTSSGTVTCQVLNIQPLMT